MTTIKENQRTECPSEYLFRILSGKWKTCIFRYASHGPVRFGQLLKILPASTKQSVTNALRDLEQDGLLKRKVIKLKPLHVEYELTSLGSSFIPVFKTIEDTLPKVGI